MVNEFWCLGCYII
uniref:Uncharacterized protein n=1 Tax=Arundo donax TaxID=35708 RepID=A0A0A8ZSD5_ARUDO